MIRSRKPKKSGGTPLRYGAIRGRQILGLSVTVWSLIIFAVLSRRPDLFGHAFGKDNASFLQILIIAAFVCFTAWNWRCPSCGRYLGADFGRKRTCRKCGAALKS